MDITAFRIGLEFWRMGSRLPSHQEQILTLVTLFAILHDSQRVNESYDPKHGPRAAEFANSLRGSLIHLSDEDFELLSLPAGIIPTNSHILM